MQPNYDSRVSQMAADTHYLSFDGEFNQKFQIGSYELLLL